jgi:NAD(P)-dependent dehydrogenase (short-subunit alcohol dehydrogenase family)
METSAEMQGNVCLITGATSGIGRATAQGLAARGGTVVVGARDESLAQKTVADIKKETGNPAVEYLLADLSVQAQVREMARAFRERHERLDVLINNAGAAFLRRNVSPDGIEMTFALNHLAYFLLTNQLLDLLKASAPARIINVSSGSHRGAEIDFNDLGMENGYGVMKAYGRSKLANLLFTYELDRRLEDSGVTVNAMHPGFVATDIGKNNGLLARLVISLLHLTARSPREGAETAIYLASSPEVEGISGKYFKDCETVRSSPASLNQADARRLWEISAEMTSA